MPRFGDGALLHRAVAANQFRKCSNGYGGAVVARLQLSQQLIKVALVLGDQFAFDTAVMAVAEHVQRRAAQELQLGQHVEGVQHPRPEFTLTRLASGAVALGQPGRCQVELQLVVAFELRLELLAELRFAVQPRHFVLVFVGKKLEVVARHCFRKRQVIRGIHRPYALDHRAIALGIGRALVLGKEVHAPVDDLFQGLAYRLGHFHRTRQLLDRLALQCRTTAPAERLLVQLCGDAVDADGLLDGLGRQRQQPLLIGKAQQEQVGGNAIAQQPSGQVGRVDEMGLFGANRIHQRFAHGLARHLSIGVAGEFGGRRFVAVDHCMADLIVEAGQRIFAGSHHQIAAQQQVGFAGRDTHGVDVVLLGGDTDVRHHRAELLRQPGLVEHGAALAFQVRSHAQQRAKRRDAAAADTGDQHVPGPIQRRTLRLRQLVTRDATGHGLRFAQPATVHRDKARAEAFDAGEVLVAGVLIDLALAPQFGFQRHHRQAVGLLAAVAAALAHGRVDEGALGRVFQLAALAPTTLLGGAGLVIDDHRDALELAQLTLHGIQIAPVMEAGDLRKGLAGRVFVRFVTDQRDAFHAFIGDLPTELIDPQFTVDGLATGHGHRIVIEDLEGDVHPGGYRGAHGQTARVEVGAIAQVLEHVRGVGERRLADPVDALATHLGEGLGAAVHPLHHVVTADAGRGAAAFGYFGGTVVRAAGAVMRRAYGVVAACSQGFFLGGEEGKARLDAVAGVDRREALGDHPGDHRGRQFGEVRQQRITLLVELTDHARTFVQRPVVELPSELVFENAAFFFNHQNLVQALGELMHRDRLQRPAHADLEHAQADRGAQRFVETEIIQRLTHVEVGLAGGDDAQTRVRRIEHHLVEVVGPSKGARGVDLVQVETFFLRQWRVRPADVHAIFGQFEVIGNASLDA